MAWASSRASSSFAFFVFWNCFSASDSFFWASRRSIFRLYLFLFSWLSFPSISSISLEKDFVICAMLLMAEE